MQRRLYAEAPKESLDDKMDGILGKGKVKTHSVVMRKPSSPNRKFDAADEEGDDRSGLSRDAQKA